MATSIISAGDASNLGLQTTGGDDGALVLRSGAAGAKVDALSIAAVGTGAFVGQVTATGFTGTLDGILGSGTAAAATVTTLVTSGIVSVDDTTTSTSGTTGSIHTDGGLGVAGTSTLIGVTTHGDDVVSDTDSTDDLGTTSVRWANLFVDGITATDQITATGFTGTLDGILGSGAAAAATTTTLASTTITASGIIKTDDTTAATSTTDGSLQTDGGLSVAADAVIGDDLFMLSDAAVLTFGADKDVTLTHVADTGILLNSTMVIQFNDASQNIGAPSNAILDINATDEIELNATLIDINGNVDISGTALITGVATHGDDVVSDTDSTDDLGTTGVRWANLFVDAITATDQITATGFTGTLDGILGSGTPAAATVTTIDASGVATATTFEPDGDTAAGDNAAIGYTAAEGLILTGQGSTSDITFKNDADATVLSIPTGTTTVLVEAGAVSQDPQANDAVIIKRDGNVYLKIYSPNDSTGGIAFGDPDDPFIGAITYNHASDSIQFYGNNAERMRILSDGKVGIGTTAPGFKVEVVGGTNDGIHIKDAASATVFGGLFTQSAALALVTRSNHALAFGSNDTTRMTITNAGLVGIGTTAPASLLEVKASSLNRANGISVVGSGANDILYIYPSADNVATIEHLINGSTSTGGVLAINPQGGNVGIGTAAPSQLLHLKSTGPAVLFIEADSDNVTESDNARIILSQDGGAVVGRIGYGVSSNAIEMVNQFGAALNFGTTNIIRMTVAAGGTVNVVGTFTAGTKTFRIAHPVPSKTDTHYLLHSSIEGPQADLIYRGRADLVSGGTVDVNIDTAAGMTEGTFNLLCGDVQCFTSNEDGWTALKGSVTGNVLTITAQDNTCTDTVSWMVIGERKDAKMIESEWTDDNGKLIVETLKSEHE